jgi:hypothetical protein
MSKNYLSSAFEIVDPILNLKIEKNESIKKFKTPNGFIL